MTVGTLHHTPFPRVLCLSPARLTRLQIIRAAVLSCGPGTLASHWAAAEVLGMAESPPLLPVHVTRPSGNGVRREGVVVHRSTVPPCDTSSGHGILCTSAARAIVDLAAIAEPDQLEETLIAAHSRGILNVRRLDELIAEATGRRGIRMLRHLLGDGPIRVRSKTELAMVRICRLAPVTAPVVNGFVDIGDRRYEADFHWPDLRLIVEVDGYGFHGGRGRANDDRDRDQRLFIAGWTVIRFTRDQIVDSPALVARRLQQILARAQ